MILQGKLFAESPIYRGNARKTLFTRDGDGTQRLVSLAGEISGTAESLMDAFIGSSRNGKNLGLLPKIWLRLYNSPIPGGLVTKVECRMREECYPKDRLFDLRMGIRLDEDRWAAEANANYKMETLFRNSVFDFVILVDDSLLKKENYAAQLYYVLTELKEGRFWFGAGKSKGMGRLRLEMDLPFKPSEKRISVNADTNYLKFSLSFNSENPVLVGWNWGKLDPDQPAFVSVEGKFLVQAMRNIPEPVRKRLEMVIGGPILSPADWKKKLTDYLPRAIALWLMERAESAKEVWSFPKSAVAKLGKGKYPVNPKLLEEAEAIIDKPFGSKEEAEAAFNETFGGAKAQKAKRILEVLESQKKVGRDFDRLAWQEVSSGLGLDPKLGDKLAEQIGNESALMQSLSLACKKIISQLHQQVDHQINLIRSDSWVDEEIAIREEHLRIKVMLLKGKIDEKQWGNPHAVPEGIRPSTWREFVDAHKRVQLHHMRNFKNLQKSINNDENHIAFLKMYRDKTRQEFAQPCNTDFRAGGPSGREISKKYGKHYDNMFMRMLSWSPSSQGQGLWEIYIPGSTIKGAFKKRASQILKTLWGESAKTTNTLNRLFGTQGERGMIFFSDAYLKDPNVKERSWCSMDGVRMDPASGKPVEEAKADYLFAYGDKLGFNLRLDIQDLKKGDEEAVSLLAHLLDDFQRGDIPLGGEKTCGFGWVKTEISEINWLSTAPDGLGTIGKKLFTSIKADELIKEGIWHKFNLQGDSLKNILTSIPPLFDKGKTAASTPPRAAQGFISHRAFGGYCGVLSVEARVLTPTMVQESGEPSFRTNLEGQPDEVINGWEFFSLSSPETNLRDQERVYALPSKTLKGLVRHLYTITANAEKASSDLGSLNPADSLFGFVGKGQNQALMGRIAFSFGLFDKAELGWFKVPYPYGAWTCRDGQWESKSVGKVPILQIAKKWRLFSHAPLAPCVKRLDGFTPDTVQAGYAKAILPGAKATFTIRFWNMNQEELQRLIWCLVLEDGLAHKVGKHKYLGFGSIKFDLLPDSFLIDWSRRYTEKKEESWKLPVTLKEWINPKVIRYYEDLKKALYAKQI